MGRCPARPHSRSGLDLRHHRHTPIARHGHPGQAYCISLALAEWLCRTADRIDPARVCGTISSSWARRICAESCEPMLAITTTSERTGHWIKMRRSLAPFTAPESLVHTRSLADFITTMSGFRFSVQPRGRCHSHSHFFVPYHGDPLKTANSGGWCPEGALYSQAPTKAHQSRLQNIASGQSVRSDGTVWTT